MQCHCRVDVLLSCWRLYRQCFLSRTRSMWQVHDNLDVIEVCDWSDVSELIASGNHEDIEMARRAQPSASILGPRSGASFASQDSWASDRWLSRRVRHLRPLHAGLKSVGKKWMQILQGRWVCAVPFRREGMSRFSEVWRFVYLCHGPQKLPSVVRQELWLALFFFAVATNGSPRACGSHGHGWRRPACRAEPHVGREISLRGLLASQFAERQNTSCRCDSNLFWRRVGRKDGVRVSACRWGYRSFRP